MTVRLAAARILRSVLDLVYPRRCGGCGIALAPGGDIEFCAGCRASLPWLDPPFCLRCGDWFSVAAEADAEGFARRDCARCRADPPAYSFARAVFRYEGPVRAAIHSFKFGGRRALGASLAALVVERVRRSTGIVDGVDALVAVPLHPRRERERGYNQARIVAARLAAETGLPLLEGGVKRVRLTPPQVGLNRPARIENMRGAFAVTDPDAVTGRKLLLVDDVMTTGATVAACARALLRAGAAEVRVLTIARG